LIDELRQAIDGGELVLHYQPKADLRTKTITAVEALVRWNHPTRGLLYPGSFLLTAEEGDLLHPLTGWVLRTATAALPSLDPSGEMAIAVNVSTDTAVRPDFVADVLNALAGTGTEPRRLILELSETALGDDRVVQAVRDLDDAGVAISVDDFGGDHLDHAGLAGLPISELKIDKRFVLSMLSDGRHAAIVRSVIGLAHQLGVVATAEGVETNRALDYLAACQCDAVQGYLLAQPMPLRSLRQCMSQLRGAIESHFPGSAG
jgi:EAL domain-containing protein (putative c-di-GMP-specific phosphodiesterase class I)